MAGIYIHIPFCRQKCYYCDFYKTVNTNQTKSFITALEKEINFRKEFLSGEKVNTIYFGGGTPSVLSANELELVVKQLHNNFEISEEAEFTFEANPDDLTPSYIEMLQNSGVNRLSIGIQSLNEKHLKKMNRRHTARQAIDAVNNAVNKGFKNISIDLIYGLPGLTENQWKQTLQKVFNLPVDHLSAYHLTYHEGTPFYTWLKKGTLKELKEEESISQFILLMDMAAEAGFEQYEISNFAKKQSYSRHNTSYWKGITYLGLGPSSHSYNGNLRRWNIGRLDAFIHAIENHTSFSEEEILTENDKYNDYIITGIRTKWGISLDFIRKNFGEKKAGNLMKNIRKYTETGKIIQHQHTFKLSREGIFVSDNIMADLMII